MSDEDPVRWSEGGGPPGSADFVRSIARPPVCPPAIRRVNPTRPPLRTRMIGSSVAVLMVIGGLSLWVLQRPRVETLTAPVVPVAATTFDAGVRADTASSDAGVRTDAALSDARSLDPDARRAAVSASARRVPEPTSVAVSFVSEHPVDPLHEATICAQNRDHACVIRLLDGRARNARGIALLVDARRALEGREMHPRRRAFAPSDEPLGHWGALFVDSNPRALVYIDGESTRRITPLQMDLPAGHHEVGLAGADGVLHESGCEVVENEVTRVVRGMR